MATAHAPLKARHLQIALYVIAALIMVDQLSQLLVTVFPFDTRAVRWRVAAFGLAVGYTATLLLADLLVIAAASGLGHRRFLRIWGVLHLIAGLALAAGVAGYVLDIMEVRAMLKPEFRRPFVITSARIALTAVMAAGVCVFALFFLWRSVGRTATRQSVPLLTDRPGDPGARA